MTESQSSPIAWPRLRHALLLLSALIASDQASAQRAIPVDNLVYPVMLTLKNSKSLLGRGSGFYITTDRAIYFVTAKHAFGNLLAPDPETQKIAETELELLSYSKDEPNPKRISLTVNLPILKENDAIKLHATDDVAIIRLTRNATVATSVTSNTGQPSRSFTPGVTAKENADEPLSSIALDSVRTFDRVLIGSDAIIHGYPASLGASQHPQFEADRPLLRKALVSGKNNQKRKIIIDGASYPGNSGGPVFQIERDGANVQFNLIGLIVSHIPSVRMTVDPHAELALLVGSNSGYSVAEPMDSVLELIHQDTAEPAAAPRVSSTAPIQPQKAAATGQTLNKRKAQQKTPSGATAPSRQSRRPPANAGRASSPPRG